MSVPVHEELNGLCGDNASKAAQCLGMHIRQRCPIRDTRHWQNVDLGTQEVIIQAVLVIVHTKCYLIHNHCTHTHTLDTH